MSDLKKSGHKRVVFLLSHPIQYFSPLFVEMAMQPDLDLLVLYCTDENVKGHIDQGFGVNVKWDIPLLDGYNYKFLKNNSWKPGLFKGFFGLINFEVIKVLYREKNSLFIIHGWSYFTNVLAIILGALMGCKVCVRGDNPINQEVLKSKSFLFFKSIILKYFLFRFIDFFMYVGKQSKEYYKFYGVKDNKLIFTPHAVDNNRFRKDYLLLKDRLIDIKKHLALPLNKTIILYSGKFIEKKRPLDILKSIRLINHKEVAIVLIGDGELRNEVETFISENSLSNVFLPGFLNQTEISNYYAVANIFVLPSGSGETWGLVINEAMNFGLPVVVSDLVGAADDLVRVGYNGYTFRCGDIKELAEKIDTIISEKKFSELGNNSIKIINEYSYENIIKAIRAIN